MADLTIPTMETEEQKKKRLAAQGQASTVNTTALPYQNTAPGATSRLPLVDAAKKEGVLPESGQNAMSWLNKAQPTAQDSQTAALQTAQQQASTPGTQTLASTTKATQDLMAAPTIDVGKALQSQMGAYDLQRAQQLEGVRQGMADTLFSGENRENLVNVALQGVTDRATLEDTTRRALTQEQEQSMLNKLNAGIATANAENQGKTTDIANLLSVAGGYEGQLGRESAKELQTLSTEGQKQITELQGNIEKGLQIDAQSYEAAQAQLDREQQAAMLKGNTEATKEIETLKSQLEQQYLASQQTWATSERLATQAYSTTTRIEQNDFDRATQILDQKAAAALQENDIKATEKIEQQRAELQRRMKETRK